MPEDDPPKHPKMFNPWIKDAYEPWSLAPENNAQPNGGAVPGSARTTISDPDSYTDMDGRQYTTYGGGKYLIPNDGEEQVSPTCGEQIDWPLRLKPCLSRPSIKERRTGTNYPVG
jgi:hypothetical protein